MATEDLTKRLIDSLKPSDEPYLVYDKRIRGFFVKVRPSGRKSYGLYYRTLSGQERRPKIGDYPPMTLTDAREKAQQWLSEVRNGSDPRTERREARTGLTFKEFGAIYLNDYAKPRKKPKSYSEDKRYLEKVLYPVMGRKKLESVTRSDIARFHKSKKATPISANRALALLSTVFNLAHEWGHRSDKTNPCEGVTKYKERKRERFLQPDELANLATTLADFERKNREPVEPSATQKTKSSGKNPKAKEPETIPESFIALIRLLILTGCRLDEIRLLRWEHVDLEDCCLELPESKSGAKRVYLNKAAIQVLAGLEPKAIGWVIQGRKRDRPLVGVQKIWQRVRKAAGLSDLRIHDLRHSYASVGVGLNMGLPIVGRLLGHTQATTTARYAHLQDDPVRAASEAIGNEIANIMRGKSARVIQVARDSGKEKPEADQANNGKK